MGSDTLYATRLIGGKKFPTKKSKYLYFLGCTIFAKIADLFVDAHYVVSEHLIEDLKPLKLKKPFKVLVDPPLYTKKFEKKPHKGFNILYYRGLGSNQVFKDWVYGYDIMASIWIRYMWSWQKTSKHTTKNVFDDAGDYIRIIEVNGDANMEEIFPIVDAMVRPCNHDGNPRMVMECEKNNIPYYWSKENPNEEDIINFIHDTLQKTQGKV